MIGMPTPYVWPAPSKICVWNVRAGASVVNALVFVTGVAPGAVALAVTEYRAETDSAHVLCHCVRALFIVPATGTPPDSADTRVSVPLAAVTVMPWPGWAAVLPAAGVMRSQASAAGLEDDPAAGLPAGPAVPEQAAASSPAMAQTAMMMTLAQLTLATVLVTAVLVTAVLVTAVLVTAGPLVERFLDVGFLSTSDLSVRGAACS
jgi:hypothetical protein